MIILNNVHADTMLLFYIVWKTTDKNCIFFKYLHSELQDRKSIRLHFGIRDGRHVNGAGIWWVTLAQHSDRVSKCLKFMIRLLLTFFKRVGKIAKTNICFVMPACLSVHLSAYNNLDITWRMIMKFDYCGIFPNSAENVEDSLKSDKNNGFSPWITLHIFDNISLNSS